MTLFLILIFLYSCGYEYPNGGVNSNLSSYITPADVDLEIIAQEPSLNAPVALDFDEQGRIWVLEMPGYMPNIEGSQEDAPVNSIKILEDTDGDGIMDKTSIFLDSLVLPRAILLAYGGLIYAEPPYLYFSEIDGTLPGKRTVIDSVYAVDGNVEHMPNSLTLSMDNWIYSTSSNTRYKRHKGKWLKEYTTPRGQWGLSKDNYGRLVYNTNSMLIATDRIMPNALFANKYLKLQENNLQSIAENQRVYPLQATAVNRGYQKGVLDESDKLVDATSACAPLFYRESIIGEWKDHAFVALPEINAIKRLRIVQDGFSSTAIQTDTIGEYLISPDEGFRPVHMKTGPDGSIYIVDMHRGIIQHKAYMTSYLREKILKRKLDTVAGMGRILRMSPQGISNSSLAYDVQSEPLKYLHGPNAFLRDKAQHELVHNNRVEYISKLKNYLKEGIDEINLLHSLWTLEGMDALEENDVLSCLKMEHKHLCFQALNILTRMEVGNKALLKDKILHMLDANDAMLDFAMVAHLGRLNLWDRSEMYEYYKRIIFRNADSNFFAEAVVADAHGHEAYFISQINNEGDTYKLNLSNWKTQLEQVVIRKQEHKAVYYYQENLKLEDRRTVGMALYNTYCATCHGNDGEGQKEIAPPLLDSEWVAGREDRLVLISLHGLSGAFEMGGKTYEYNSVMPGIGANDGLSDTDVKDLLHFVRNAFASADYSISEELVSLMRNYGPTDQLTFTDSSLTAKLKYFDSMNIDKN